MTKATKTLTILILVTIGLFSVANARETRNALTTSVGERQIVRISQVDRVVRITDKNRNNEGQLSARVLRNGAERIRVGNIERNLNVRDNRYASDSRLSSNAREETIGNLINAREARDSQDAQDARDARADVLRIRAAVRSKS